MTPEMAKAMLEAWIKYTLLPIVEGAIKSRIPLSQIAAVLASSAVRVAKQAQMSRDDLMALIADSWDRQPAPPPT